MEPVIELVPADPRQVVSPIIEEQVLQHRGRVVARRRVARPQAPIELDQGLVLALGRVLLERRLDVATIRVGIDVGEGAQQLVVGS